jgi:hypothetical protein
MKSKKYFSIIYLLLSINLSYLSFVNKKFSFDCKSWRTEVENLIQLYNWTFSLNHLNGCDLNHHNLYVISVPMNEYFEDNFLSLPLMLLMALYCCHLIIFYMYLNRFYEY